MKAPQSAGEVISALVGGSREKARLEARRAPTTDFDREVMARAAAAWEVVSRHADIERADVIHGYGVEELTAEELKALGFDPN